MSSSTIWRSHYLEFTMTTYIPALIWALSAVACHLIAKRRHVKKTVVIDLVVTVLGPVAIPFVMIAKPQRFSPT
jgi:cyanate permease